MEAAKSYSVMLGRKAVGFSKGGQNWPQIFSTRLSFQDRGHLNYKFTISYSFFPCFITPKLAQLVKAPVSPSRLTKLASELKPVRFPVGFLLDGTTCILLEELKFIF